MSNIPWLLIALVTFLASFARTAISFGQYRIDAVHDRRARYVMRGVAVAIFVVSQWHVVGPLVAARSNDSTAAGTAATESAITEPADSSSSTFGEPSTTDGVVADEDSQDAPTHTTTGDLIQKELDISEHGAALQDCGLTPTVIRSIDDAEDAAPFYCPIDIGVVYAVIPASPLKCDWALEFILTDQLKGMSGAVAWGSISFSLVDVCYLHPTADKPRLVIDAPSATVGRPDPAETTAWNLTPGNCILSDLEAYVRGVKLVGCDAPEAWIYVGSIAELGDSVCDPLIGSLLVEPEPTTTSYGALRIDDYRTVDDARARADNGTHCLVTSARYVWTGEGTLRRTDAP